MDISKYFKFENIRHLFIRLWPLSVIFLFVRIFIIRINISGIEKNFNLGLIGLAVLVMLGAFVLFYEYKLKIVHVVIPFLMLVGFIWIVNVYTTLISINTIISRGMLISLTISYILGLIMVGWIKLLVKYVKLSRTRRIVIKGVELFLILLSILPIYSFVLGIAQIITVYFFKNTYSTFPVFLKRLVNNGYFLKDVPPHQFIRSHSLIVRPVGILGDANVNGMLMFILFLVLTTLLLGSLKYTRNSQQLIKWLVVGVIFSFLGGIFSLSRSALLGFIVVIIPVAIGLWLPIFKSMNAKLQKLLIQIAIKFFGSLFIIVGLIFMLIPNFRNDLIKYVGQASNLKKDGSAAIHFRLATRAIKLAKENKYKPWGLGTFPDVYLKRVNKNSPNGASPHSVYATILMEQGLIGEIIYIIVFIGVWVNFIYGIFKFKKYFATQKESDPNLIRLLGTTLNLAIPFLTISTIFYYGFWDISTWWWGIHSFSPKKQE